MEFQHSEEEFSYRDTLCYIFRGEKVLMIEKQSGPRPQNFSGDRFLNGPGGKIEDEPPRECAIRELEEEINVTPENINKIGEVAYYRDEEPERFIHVYRTEEYSGEVSEGDEIPTWEKIEDLEYSEMWPSDGFWMPEMIAGENFKTEVFYRNGRFMDEKSRIETGVEFQN